MRPNQPRGPGEASWCREAKIAARQFLPLGCRAITLTTGAILKQEEMSSIVGERQFGRHFKRSNSHPHPQPQNSLLRIFRLQPGLEWKFLLRRTCCRGKNCSHCSFQDFHSLSKENQVSLVRTFLSDPGSESKISRLGGWGWKNDPEKTLHGRPVFIQCGCWGTLRSLYEGAEPQPSTG